MLVVAPEGLTFRSVSSQSVKAERESESTSTCESSACSKCQKIPCSSNSRDRKSKSVSRNCTQYSSVGSCPRAATRKSDSESSPKIASAICTGVLPWKMRLPCRRVSSHIHGTTSQW